MDDESGGFLVRKEKTVKNNSTGRFAFLGVAPIWDGAFAVNYFLSTETSLVRSVAKMAAVNGVTLEKEPETLRINVYQDSVHEMTFHSGQNGYTNIR